MLRQQARRSSSLRRLTVATLLAALLAVPAIAVGQARSSGEVARELQETQQQADALARRRAALQGDIDAAREELAQIAVRLEDARGRLRHAEGQVALAEEGLAEAEEIRHAADADLVRAENLLARAEERLADEEAKFHEQVAAAYKHGGAGGGARGAMLLEMLRRAQDPNAFAVGMHQLQIVVDDQDQTVRRVFELRQQREELAQAATVARARAVQAERDAATTLALVEDLRDQAAAIAAEVADEERQQTEVLAALQRDERATATLLSEVEGRARTLSVELAQRRDAERREAERRASQAAANRSTAGAGGGSPVPGGHCPVVGAVAGRDFSNDWGYPRPGGRTHQGNDIFANRGTPVVAITDGVVIRMNTLEGQNRLGGLTVTYRTGDGSEWYNAHLDEIQPGLTIGSRVAAGEQIGTVGNTGNARTTPPHLHIGRRVSGGWVNPYPTIAPLCR